MSEFANKWVQIRQDFITRWVFKGFQLQEFFFFLNFGFLHLYSYEHYREIGKASEKGIFFPGGQSRVEEWQANDFVIESLVKVSRIRP